MVADSGALCDRVDHVVARTPPGTYRRSGNEKPVPLPHTRRKDTSPPQLNKIVDPEFPTVKVLQERFRVAEDEVESFEFGCGRGPSCYCDLVCNLYGSSTQAH